MVRPSFLNIVVLFFSLMMIQLAPNSAWAEEEAVAVKKPIYYAFSEPFTINFLRQSNNEARYLQVKVSTMSYDQAVIDNLELNLPMMQDALRTLFTLQTMDAVTTVEGRRMIQAEALNTIKTLLREETGNDAIEGVYFTSFILQ